VFVIGLDVRLCLLSSLCLLCDMLQAGKSIDADKSEGKKKRLVVRTVSEEGEEGRRPRRTSRDDLHKISTSHTTSVYILSCSSILCTSCDDCPSYCLNIVHDQVISTLMIRINVVSRTCMCIDRCIHIYNSNRYLE